MSTLRLSVGLLILLFLLGLVGCSSTSGVRTANPPKIRTLASIGDKPLPIVTGEPGATVNPTTEPPERQQSRADRRGLISGRVIDEQGKPVAGARVRLAVSSASGGRVAGATTDRGGGFTLRGLRPGSSYTVIAEWDDGQEILSGRSDAEAPDTEVTIALAAAGAGKGASTGTGTLRVDPVSRRGPASIPHEDGAEALVTAAAAGAVNEEDLPPAPEAESFAPATRRNSRVRTQPEPDPDDALPTSGTGAWRPLDRVSRSSRDRDFDASSRRAAEPELAPRQEPGSVPSADTSPEDEDGPNPLPPALEPGHASRPPVDPDLDRDPFADDHAGHIQQVMALTHQETPTPGPNTDESEGPPGALVAAPQSQSPGPAVLPDSLLPPPVESPGPAPVSPELLSSTPPPMQPSAAPPPRPRWRDLMAEPGNLPPREGSSDPHLVAGPGSPVSDPGAARTARGSPPEKEKEKEKEPDTFCRFDSKLHRIEDFRLPDSQGRLVRFQDIDADLILLDFWGTWCQPCIRSIPHLVDLQRRLGGKQLQVVGIACERAETPPAQRAAGVAQTVQKLGINYPVLLTSLGATCPLQKALKVQTFPTMILVDRRGRILWQNQGATRLTLYRLDRMLNLAIKSSDGKRRY